jgi:hypothetical protein
MVSEMSERTEVNFLAPSQVDLGDVVWHYWDATEAGKYRSWSCGKLRTFMALVRISIIP